MLKKYCSLRYLWFILLVVVLDQVTKFVASADLEFHQLTHVMPYFDWYLAHNKGAAFSFLADQGGWQRWFFTILTSVIIVILLVWLKRLQPHKKVTAVALSLIIGGAIGNLVDRVTLGYVIDFIQIWLGTYPWPSFNVADMAISTGAVLLISADLIFGENKEKRVKTND